MSKDCGSFKDIEWGGHNTNRLLLFIFLFSFWWRGGASVPFGRADYATCVRLVPNKILDILVPLLSIINPRHIDEFSSFLSSRFTTAMAVANSPEKKLSKRTSVHF